MLIYMELNVFPRNEIYGFPLLFFYQSSVNFTKYYCQLPVHSTFHTLL